MCTGARSLSLIRQDRLDMISRDRFTELLFNSKYLKLDKGYGINFGSSRGCTSGEQRSSKKGSRPIVNKGDNIPSFVELLDRYGVYTCTYIRKGPYLMSNAVTRAHLHRPSHTASGIY
jgi:hypothetical protein